ncbi:MAG: hypothetical protein JWN72_2247 [Thermoleophilia bacterium]|nr:hypothetical protein [Thermoleophilia bacterium]
MTDGEPADVEHEDPVEERTDGVTPAGGAYTIARYYDSDGTPAPRSRAHRVTFTEYDSEGAAIASTSGTI